MQELVKINQQQIGSEQVNTVNARELWEFIESKQEFANWIKNRIDKYGFVESEDFLIILSKSNGGRPIQEYHISIDMAKELAMVENNNKGRKVRQYFIEIEKQWKQQPKELTRLELIEMALESEKKRLALEAKVEKDKPAVDYANKVAESEGLVMIGDFAESVGIGRNNLFAWMRGHKPKIMKYNSIGNNVPMQCYIDQGYFEVKKRLKSDGNPYYTTYITGKGEQWLTKLLNKEWDQPMLVKVDAKKQGKYLKRIIPQP